MSVASGHVRGAEVEANGGPQGTMERRSGGRHERRRVPGAQRGNVALIAALLVCRWRVKFADSDCCHRSYRQQAPLRKPTFPGQEVPGHDVQ